MGFAGAPLVVRGGAAFALTAEGRAIAQAAASMEATVTATTRDVRAMRDEPGGVVRIACVPTALHFLGTFGAEVAAMHPGLQVELLSGRDVVDLARGDADIAIRTAEPTEPDLVVGYRFAWGGCLYASEACVAQHGLPDMPDDLRRHQLVRYDTRVLHLNAFGWIERYADPAFPAIRIENSDRARVMIERGVGIGPLFCAVGDTCKTLVRVFSRALRPDPVLDRLPRNCARLGKGAGGDGCAGGVPQGAAAAADRAGAGAGPGLRRGETKALSGRPFPGGISPPVPPGNCSRIRRGRCCAGTGRRGPAPRGNRRAAPSRPRA